MTTQCRSGACYIVQVRRRGHLSTLVGQDPRTLVYIGRSRSYDTCLLSVSQEERIHVRIVQVRSRGYMSTQCRSDAEIHVCIVQQERTLNYIGRSGSEDTYLHSVGQEERIHVYIVKVRSRGYMSTQCRSESEDAACPHIESQVKRTCIEDRGYMSTQCRSRVHERTISLRFLGIILRVLRLEVSVWIS